MEPRESEATKRLGAWADAQRQAGRKVLGFNLHAMLYKDTVERDAALKAVAEQLGAFLTAHDDVALMLIPHDYRKDGDLGCLKPIYESLTQRHKGHEERLGAIYLVSDELSAPELKALCGHLDCLFTSRMHLAIAALGMGKPVAAFAYQGKFAGLFRHFDLPENLILPPTAVDRLGAVLDILAGSSPAPSALITTRRTSIRTLATINLVDNSVNEMRMAVNLGAK